MNDSIWELPLNAALDQTASASPTPGGGSIAVVTGAFGLGLVLMALEVSANKQPSPALTQALVEGRALLNELTGCADRDVAVFRAYMDALRLPKATAQEQAARAEARAAASLDAARAPLGAAEICLRAIAFAQDSAAHVHEHVWSDLLAGTDLLFGSCKAVLRTLAINLPLLRDEPARQELEQRAARVEREASELYARVASQEV